MGVQDRDYMHRRDEEPVQTESEVEVAREASGFLAWLNSLTTRSYSFKQICWAWILGGVWVVLFRTVRQIWF